MDMVSYSIGVVAGLMMGLQIKRLDPLPKIKLSKRDYITIGTIFAGIVILIIGITMEWQTKYF